MVSLRLSPTLTIMVFVVAVCLSSSADCNPLVNAMVKSPSAMFGCFLPSSVMMSISFNTKSPVMFTFPIIEPPVSSYLPSNAVCNPLVFAMVKSPSAIVSCFVPISVMTLVVPTTKSPVMVTFPFIEPPVSSYLLSKASCNPSVNAMVKSPSVMFGCFLPSSVMMSISFNTK